LSKEYVNVREPLLWRCGNGHRWQAPAGTVKPSGFRMGSWCPICPRRNKGKPARLTIEEMRQIASERGGECRSESYLNCNTKLKWRCAEGHEWEAKPGSVKHGTWCPVCAGTQKLTLKSLQEEAKSRGGRLLSTEYVDSHSSLLWKCKEGHKWEAAASKIRYGTWCPQCAGKARLSLDEMHALAAARGGKCLSKRYLNLVTPLRWRCAKGHVWKAAPGMVKPSGYQEQGTWCPRCAQEPRYSIADMNALARLHGGECLSKVYRNNDTPLRWRCAQGHIWKAKPNSIRPYTQKTRGSWCPACAVEKRKLTIEDMQEVARARGGECLSARYVNNRTPLHWRCAEGHVWEAKPSHIRPYGAERRSSWCPQCAGRHRPDLRKNPSALA